MSKNWLDHEFEKAGKKASAFPNWMQDAIKNESSKSGRAVENSRRDKESTVVETRGAEKEQKRT